MKFGPVPVSEALGAVLAHSAMARVDGQPRRIAKGTAITCDIQAALIVAGHESVTVARLGPDDVDENAAAAALASAIVPDPERAGLRIATAGAGRVNLYAQGPGLVQQDEGAIHALNAVDPMITIATLPTHMRVDPGTMVATIKIIAYAVPQAALDRAADAARGALSLAAPAFQTATLIETSVADDTPADKGRRVTADRLARFGITLTPRLVVPHREAEIAAAIADAPGDLVLLLTASATSDPADVAPQALRRAGGHVEAYGMPVDPGNLLFFGDVSARPVIGLPGSTGIP